MKLWRSVGMVMTRNVLFFKGIFECSLAHIRDIGRWRKSDDHPKKDLAKFNYMKHKYLIIFPHFWLLGTKYRNVITFFFFFFLFFLRLLLGFSDFWQLRPPKITSFFEFWILPALEFSQWAPSKTCPKHAILEGQVACLGFLLGNFCNTK